MDIVQGMQDDIGKSLLSRINSTSQKGRGARQSPPRLGEGDHADTSVLSQLMARSTSDLASVMKPRPEVVARFKGSVDNVDLSDRVVNTILKRLVADS